MWYHSALDADNRIFPPFVLGIFLFLMLVRFGLSKRHFLIINDKGITLNYLLGKRKFARWETIDKFKYHDCRESRKGWTVLYKKDAGRIGSLKKEACILFIPANHVAASSIAVNEALKRGFQEHVWHGSSYQNDFDSAKIDGNPKGVYALFLIWIALNLLYFYLDPLLSSYTQMERTLASGEGFEGTLSVIVFIVWTINFSVFVPLLFLPIHVTMIRSRGYSVPLSDPLRYYSWYWRVLIAFTIIAISFKLSINRKVHMNCSDPITNPIETINAMVKEIDRKSIEFSFTYEGGKCEFGHSEYIKDAYEGMPAVVKLQEGVRGLPIVHEKTIPEIGWESKKSTEYDCCFTSFSYLCREKQKDL
jgi:hypothetical protein